jgi:N-acetylmuramoyl-L-alanine amidase
LLIRLAVAVVLATSLVTAASAQTRTAAVQRIAVSESQGITQLTIGLTHATEYEIALLDEPNRLMVGFTRARWGVRWTDVRAAGVIAGFRPPPSDADRARIVLDLGEPAKVRRARFVPGARRPAIALVIELEPVSLEAFRELARPWSPSAPSDRRTADARMGARPLTQLAAVPGRGPLPRAAPPLAEPRRELPMILLDPGHGGADPGATGRSGTQEKTVVLAIAREVRRQLEATRRYRVAMTRDGDEFIALRDRLALARAYDADLFISLHADSIRHPDMRGVSVYTLSESASDEEAAALAQRENRADLIAGVDLSRAPWCGGSTCTSAPTAAGGERARAGDAAGRRGIVSRRRSLWMVVRGSSPRDRSEKASCGGHATTCRARLLDGGELWYR